MVQPGLHAVLGRQAVSGSGVVAGRARAAGVGGRGGWLPATMWSRWFIGCTVPRTAKCSARRLLMRSTPSIGHRLLTQPSSAAGRRGDLAYQIL
jgi:hypothetical protein